MKKIWLLPVLATLTIGLPAHAQDQPALPEEPAMDPPVAAAPKTPDLMIVDARNVANLRALVPGKGAHAISLNLSRAALSADATAWSALSNWVKGGGTVFLHTDAAQLFGYTTAKPRQGNARVAGQLWGRAKAAVPFGAHPLLLGAASKNDRQALQSAISGVRVVYYQLNEGDELAVSHPAAVPILRVTDLAVSGGRPLYAAAAAPYGSGWALFTPGFVEQDRADGGLFVYNLMKFAGAVVSDSPDDAADANNPDEGSSTPSPVNLPAAIIEAAATQAQGAGFDASATAMNFLKAIQPVMPASAAAEAPAAEAPGGEVPGGADAAAAPDKTVKIPAATTAGTGDDEIGLPVSRAEFGAVLQILGGVRADGEDTVDRAKAALFLLRARLAWQQSDNRAVTQWLGRANDIAGGTAEGSLLAGLAYAEASDDITLPSGQRATLLANAVNAWKQSIAAAPLIQAAGAGAAAKASVIRDPNAKAPEVMIGGISRSVIQDWVRTSTYTARLYAVEPPLVNTVGNNDNGLAVRYFDDDPTLGVAVPAAQQLTTFSDALGARGDDEEVLFFPTAEYYAAYRQAAGFNNQNAPAPGGYVGDAIDGRMLILSLPSQMILIPSGNPKIPPRPAPFPSAAPNVMGRIHSQVLINQLAGGLKEGEQRVPVWLRMGLATYTAKGMATALGTGEPPNQNPANDGGFGKLLSPGDYENLGNGADNDTIADVEAGRLVDYFYSRFGPGRVVETLQRLGSGESPDDAMEATTGLTQEQFFTAWYNAETNNNR